MAVLAANQHELSVSPYLGWMYYNGVSVTQNYRTAFKWYKASAEWGDVLAQYGLGLMYENGKGVDQDYIRAHMWFNVSASGVNVPEGLKDSREARDRVENKMNSTQINRAQELAQECVRKLWKGC